VPNAGFEGALSKEGWLKYYVGLKDGALVVSAPPTPTA